MAFAGNIGCETIPGAVIASGFGWAQRLVRRQIDTLQRLAGVASRMMSDAMGRVMAASDGAAHGEALTVRSVFADLRAIEKAVGLHEKVSWALRLIDALSEKLSDDLQRLDRGEAPDQVLAGEASVASETAAPAQGAAGARALSDRAERDDGAYRERPERPERFGRFLDDDDFSEILKRPTDEIIALICRELGLPADWSDLAEDASASEAMDESLGDFAWALPPPLGYDALVGKPPDG